MILLLDIIDSIYYFFSLFHYFSKEYNYLTSVITSVLGFIVAKYGDRFIHNLTVDLNYHTVFSKIDEAYLQIQRIPYKSQFRRKTILLWHKIVLDYQKKFCIEAVEMLSDGKGKFSQRSSKLAQDMLNQFTIELQNQLPEKLERYYSSFAYLGRDQLRDVVLHYANAKGLTDKERAEKYLQNVEFFANYVALIANFQNDLNGELRGIEFFDKETGITLIDDIE
jgi:hypothetical protein